MFNVQELADEMFGKNHDKNKFLSAIVFGKPTSTDPFGILKNSIAFKIAVAEGFGSKSITYYIDDEMFKLTAKQICNMVRSTNSWKDFLEQQYGDAFNVLSHPRMDLISVFMEGISKNSKGSAKRNNFIQR